MRMLLPLALAVSLTACASTPTTYAPANGRDRGYSEQQIESDRFRIHFDAGADMSLRDAEDMALRRAAEVTLLNDGEWFLVVSRSRDGNDRDPVRVRTGVSHRFGSGGRSGTSVGVGVHFDGDAGEKRVSLEILVRTGEMPQDRNAYNAVDVLNYAEID